MEKRIGNYDVINLLKQGAQGLVYLARDVNGEKIVIKSIPVDLEKKIEVEAVLKSWKELSLSGTNIVPYIEHFFNDNRLCCVMKFCSKGDLDTLIKKRFFENRKFSESEVFHVMFDGMTGLQGMHSKKWIHRDIKSANLLIDEDGRVLISDFGTAKIVNMETSTMTVVGTMLYVAPEVLNNEEYSFPIDVFSLGVVFYEMITGKNPFMGDRGPKMASLLRAEYPPIPPELGYSPELMDIIHSCLALNPALRPTPASFLASPWVARMRRADEEKVQLKRELQEELQHNLAEYRETLASQALQIADLTKKLHAAETKTQELEAWMASTKAHPCMRAPDWSRGVAQLGNYPGTWNAERVAPEDGWLYIHGFVGEQWKCCVVSINGEANKIMVNAHSFTHAGMFIPVAKNDRYKFTDGTGIHTDGKCHLEFKFYPFV